MLVLHWCWIQIGFWIFPLLLLQVSLATVIFVASQSSLSSKVKTVIKQQLENVANGWTVYRIARQASRMVILPACTKPGCAMCLNTSQGSLVGWWGCVNRASKVSPAGLVAASLDLSHWWANYHRSPGLPWVLQWTVPEPAHPSGVRAFLLLAEQPERVFPGRAMSESCGGRRLQRSYECHRRGPALLPKGHRFPHSQYTARHLLVKRH